MNKCMREVGYQAARVHGDPMKQHSVHGLASRCIYDRVYDSAVEHGSAAFNTADPRLSRAPI